MQLHSGILSLAAFLYLSHSLSLILILPHLTNSEMILPTALILALAQPALSLATDRATWLWDATMMQDSAQVADFLAFAEAKGVTKVYAGVNADVPNEAFGSFIEGCSARGIAVGALIGNSQWILDRGTPSLEDNLSWIEQYQGSSVVASDGGKRFAEVHMDIEVSLLTYLVPSSILYLVIVAVMADIKEYGIRRKN